MSDNLCIVFGNDYYNTYGVLRSLGENGIFPIFINVCNQESWVSKSRYYSQYHQVSTYEEGLLIMTSCYSGRRNKPVVICTTDEAAQSVDSHLDTLLPDFVVPNAGKKAGAISKLLNKNEQFRHANEVGFTTPHSVTISPSDNIREEIANVSYPCHVKPTNSLNGEKQDMHICRSRNELERALCSLIGKCPKVEVQDYLEKDYEIVLMGCVLRTGEVVMPGAVIKTREWPYQGHTSYTIMKKGWLDMDKEPFLRFLKLTGFYGIFSMEFIVKDGVYYFLEANFRSDANNYTPTAGGVNLPLMWVLDACGNNTSSMPRTILREVRSQVEFVDFDYMKHHPSSFFRWTWDTLLADNYMIYNKRDKKPFRYITKQPLQYRCLSLMYDSLNLFKRNI